MSNALIEGLQPALRSLAREHRLRAEKRGIAIVFTAGRRTPDEQWAAYRKGRMLTPAGNWDVVDAGKVVTFAMPDRAPHCRGAAYDLCPIVAERAAWDRLDLFGELGRIGEDLGLVWGGRWAKLKDMPHFELAGWRLLPWP